MPASPKKRGEYNPSVPGSKKESPFLGVREKRERRGITTPYREQCFQKGGQKKKFLSRGQPPKPPPRKSAKLNKKKKGGSLKKTQQKLHLLGKRENFGWGKEG